jgi:PRTRC genetic system ThiF family protein
MSYTLNTTWHGGRLASRDGWTVYPPRTEPLDASIVLVGCGGTGGFLATAIARLLQGRDAELCLVDHDRVAPVNLGRQAFSHADLDRFKAEVLAERLARDLGMSVSYSVLPYDVGLHRDFFNARARLALVVGAVDNAAARREIARTLEYGQVLWLDCGNGYNSGQVLLGNALSANDLHGSFQLETDTCFALPAPSLQRPDLMVAPPQPREDPNCAVAVERAEQSATINQTMAALAAAYVERLLNGTCSWMATYLDMELGSVQTVSAEPERVASLIHKRTSYVAHKAPVRKAA